MVDDTIEKVPSTSTLVDPTSSSWARPVLTNARLAIEQGLDIVIEESKPEDVEDMNWLTINRKELRRKDKQISSSGDVEVLLVRSHRRRRAPIRDGDPSRGRDSTKMNVPFFMEKVIGKETDQGAITNGDRNSEAVKLWHMRLGHVGEKSLNLLIKQGLLKGLSSYIDVTVSLYAPDAVLIPMNRSLTP
ncbi:retrovirus-related pol polyprotein from transposon TNT 1-94 [Tanacetum coccineum]